MANPIETDRRAELGIGLNDRSIDMQVARLRKLVEPEPSTVWGAGYSFVPDGAR